MEFFRWTWFKRNNAETLIPENTEEHLSYIFGDYMTLPPENERVTHSIQFVED